MAVSISEPYEVLQNRVTFYPRGFSLAAYKLVFQNKDFLHSYLNTLRYTTVGLLVNLVMTVMTAYPLSRRRFLGKGIFQRLIVFTMLFSGGTIPTYIMVMNLGLIDKFWAVILPVAINTFNLMILRTAFQAMPEELEEAAKIDGCNDFQILWRIFLPLSKTVLMTIGLFYAVGHWNAFFVPFLYLNTGRCTRCRSSSEACSSRARCGLRQCDQHRDRRHTDPEIRHDHRDHHPDHHGISLYSAVFHQGRPPRVTQGMSIIESAGNLGD